MARDREGHSLSSPAKGVDPYRVRYWIFLILLMIAGLSYGVMDYFDWCDEALASYSLELVVAGLCGGWYCWWWWKVGSASDVFKWVTALFLSIMVRLIITIVGRREVLCGNTDLVIGGCYWWTIRNWPEIIVLLYMLALVLGRIWCNIPMHECLDEE